MISTVNNAAAVRSVIQSAKSGDIVLIAPGSYSFSQSIVIPSGVTITAANPYSYPTLTFTLAASDPLAFIFAGNSKGSAVVGLKIVSNYCLFKLMDGNGYSNISIIANQLTHGGGTMNGSLVYGITQTVGCDNFQVCWNDWIDSPHSNRSWACFSDTNSKFEHNLYRNVQDGGQIQFPGQNVSFSWNYGTGLYNKGQEGALRDSVNFLIQGNVFYDWSSTNNSSMGISILATGPAGTVQPVGWPVNVVGNYIRLSLAGGAAGGVSGVVYELGGGPLNFSDNLGGGATAPGIVSIDTQNSVGSGSALYGPTTWGGAIGGEGGPNGGGTWIGEKPSYDTNLSHMPPPPANTIAGTAIYQATNAGVNWNPSWKPGPVVVVPPVVVPPVVVPPVIVPAVTPLTITHTAGLTSCTLNWNTPLTNISVRVYTPADPCGTLLAAGPLSGGVVGNLNQGWDYFVEVKGTNAAGQVCDGVVNFNTLGQSPDETKATQATFTQVTMPTAKVQTVNQKTVITTPYTNGVAGTPQSVVTTTSQTVTTWNDGSTSTVTP